MNMIEPAKFITEALRGKLRSNVAMCRRGGRRAGGYAERVYQPADLADLIVFLRTLPADELLVAVGLGSNLLVRDGGVRGMVLLLHAALTEMRIETDGSIYVQAGVSGAKLARFAAKHNLRGAEFFAGIPGTLGGMLATPVNLVFRLFTKRSFSSVRDCACPLATATSLAARLSRCYPSALPPSP